MADVVRIDRVRRRREPMPRTRVGALRRFAHEVAVLARRIEDETRLDATKLRAFGLHLENVADRLEGHPL